MAREVEENTAYYSRSKNIPIRSVTTPWSDFSSWGARHDVFAIPIQTHQLTLDCRWTAPEALESHKFNQRTDTWSMGITMYEMWTRAALPYAGMNNAKVCGVRVHGREWK